MPGYGVVGEREGSGLLAWLWATTRLEASHDYWLATVRPDGRPHVRPVWGVYFDDRLWFSSGPGSRKVANIRCNDAVVMTTDDPFTPVIVEGDATKQTDPKLPLEADASLRHLEMLPQNYGTSMGQSR